MTMKLLMIMMNEEEEEEKSINLSNLLTKMMKHWHPDFHLSLSPQSLLISLYTLSCWFKIAETQTKMIEFKLFAFLWSRWF